MKFEDRCQLMVQEQIQARGVNDSAILTAFLTVPRHLFVPDEYREHAYEDHPLGIGTGQTISQPYMVALMLKEMQLNKEDTVLEIGTGSGYQTALLAELAGIVFTVERHNSLTRSARTVLRKLEYTNIHFRTGDGTLGWEKAWPPQAEFDKIIVAAAAPQIPPALLNQLADNGRLVIPVGSSSFQRLIIMERKGDNFERTEKDGCTFVPLIGQQGWPDE
ncbi:MAG: protein-L-isoaspartate(D-aspartate) O-methyltransferase [Candidatus Cloacimonetes bacterium]|nr:protein-L-isoaspartate(D-aspartate) O-methyltransferase [Candidatus Cloacimonadota bacterium]